MNAKKQDFNIVCRNCKVTVAGEVSDRGHVCHPLVEKKGREEELKQRIGLIIFPEHSTACQSSFQAGYGYGKLMPRDKCFCGAFDRNDKTVKLFLTLFTEELKKWYYIGVGEGQSTDEYGEKRAYTESDLSYHLFVHKETLIKKVNRLFTLRKGDVVKRYTDFHSDLLALLKK